MSHCAPGFSSKMADAPSSSNDKRLHENIAEFFYSAYTALRSSAFTESRHKAAIYWIIVVLGSFIGHFYPLPESYLSYKNNIFNSYFAKFSWGWTWLILSLLTVLCTSILTSGNVAKMMRHYARLLFATIAWFLWTKVVFHTLEHFTGSCTGDSSHTSKLACHRNGYFWDGFDTSGHSFLLIHCCLTISEEIQMVKYLEKKIQETYNQQSPGSKQGLSFNALAWYKILWPVIYLVFICTALLMVLWEFLLVVTCVYFHSVEEKLLGALAAILTWYSTYNFLYFKYDEVVLPNFK